MSNNIFSVGDRVSVDTTCYAKKYPPHIHDAFQDTGVIVFIQDCSINALPYAVKMDHPHPGECHDCGNRIQNEYGYWCDNTMISHLKIEPIQPYKRSNLLRSLFLKTKKASHHEKV